ncbi:hypothetical protein CB1_001792005 [Camelus ferus]|nr:hypothetical protein CB1_001792005 [Camelus ferus]
MYYLTLLLAMFHVYKGLGKLRISLRCLSGVLITKSNRINVMLYVSALCEEIFWDTTVTLAENLTLECVYPSTDTLTQMEWFKVNTQEKESIAILSPTYGAVVREPYAGRVYFSNSTLASNDMTLSFRNASEADVGFYSCFLHTFPHGPWEKVIRVVPSGLYRCGFKASTGENETFVIRLTVTHGEHNIQNFLFVAGGAGLLLLLVILITTIIVILLKRRKRQKRGLFKEHWDTQNKAANNYRNPVSTNQPSDGAGEDVYVNYPTFSRRPKTRV